MNTSVCACMNDRECSTHTNTLNWDKDRYLYQSECSLTVSTAQDVTEHIGTHMHTQAYSWKIFGSSIWFRRESWKWKVRNSRVHCDHLGSSTSHH